MAGKDEKLIQHGTSPTNSPSDGKIASPLRWRRSAHDEDKPPLSSYFPLACVLHHIYSQSGVRGLYTGCDAQIYNTTLKSALLLLTKEQISGLTTFLLRRIYGRSDVGMMKKGFR